MVDIDHPGRWVGSRRPVQPGPRRPQQWEGTEQLGEGRWLDQREGNGEEAVSRSLLQNAERSKRFQFCLFCYKLHVSTIYANNEYVNWKQETYYKSLINYRASVWMLGQNLQAITYKV